ncbi:hypothetical protein EVJ27_13580 [Exiguobacterium sp. SH3S2]|uniref:hypothetical protein n=1 Tax=unclassified Exiguobacterium TaxID=2644629 RepID=UPI001039F798|nr:MULTISPECIES: hypothetical protein [unclassified Exiguobacterium]TCI41595.1 hypothetical protein EVJ28_13520 [Exiguobacterium sp. SH3S3]TCI58211.1 hypothetical protein EVJ27_13580 [Exiguobacterium sp. SH3S2]
MVHIIRRIIGTLIGIGFIVYGTGMLLSHVMFGDPRDEQRALEAAEQYVASQYPEMDLSAVHAGLMIWGDDTYVITIASPSSEDTRFYVTVAADGTILSDEYDDVLSGMVTFNRLNEEYRPLVETALISLPFDYKLYEDVLTVYEGEESPYEALDPATLLLDHDYDIHAIGRDYGSLFVAVEDEAATAIRASALMRDVKRALDEADVPFRTLLLTIQDGNESFYSGRVTPYSIDAEGLEEQLKQNNIDWVTGLNE